VIQHTPATEALYMQAQRQLQRLRP
jgi:hypothetical protein